MGEGNGTPLQYSCLENPMDPRAWQAAVHGVAQSRARLSDFTFTFHFHALEEDMATHSSVLAWRTPGTAGPGGLPYMPRYLMLADPGVEGLEWFAASELSQWDLQLTGQRGQGQFVLDRTKDPA